LYQICRIACKLNLALAYINTSDFISAITEATSALSKDPNNVKALYRRGLARNRIGSPDNALVDLNAALVINPTNMSVKAEILKSRSLIANAAKQNQNSVFRNIFS
jgi:peptidylprolyl isomerase